MLLLNQKFILLHVVVLAVIYKLYLLNQSSSSSSSTTTEQLLRNWDGNVIIKPDFTHQPRHKQELIQLVKNVHDTNGYLKVIGAHHSWSGITQVPSVTSAGTRKRHVANLDHMDQVLSLKIFNEREKRDSGVGQEFVGTVTVEAGIRLKNLIQYLEQRRYTLKMLGSVTEQSIAGAISTGTHGSSRHVPVMANMVVGMEMLLANGTLVTIDESSELLDAVRVNLGCLGIITQVELLIVDVFHLHLTEQPVHFDDLPSVSDLIDRSEYAKIWWFPHTNYTQLYTMNATVYTSSPTVLDNVVDWFENTLVNTHLLEVLVRLVTLFPPSVIPHVNRIVEKVSWRKREQIDYSHNILPLKHGLPVHREMEFSVPFDFWVDTLRALSSLENEVYFDFVSEFRFVKGDSVWMSPGYKRDSVFITITNYNQPAERFFGACQTILSNLMQELRAKHGHRYASDEERDLIFSLRPHWGKTHYLTSKDIRRVLPKFDQFVQLREEWDPNNMFMNDLLQSFLY